jgi:hypothetical protein
MHHEGGRGLRKGDWVDAGTKKNEGEDLSGVDGEGVYAYRVEFVQTDADASEEEESKRRRADLRVKGGQLGKGGIRCSSLVFPGFCCLR